MNNIRSIDWKFVFLGAAVGIAGPAWVGTAMFNIATIVMTKQGTTQQDIYAYFVSDSMNLIGMLALVYSTGFAFLCGRVAIMRTGQASGLAGIAAGLIALSFQGVMALNVASDPRLGWQIALGVLVPVLGSAVGALLPRSSRAA